MNKESILQIAKFLTVGTIAAMIHFTVVILLVQFYHLEPLVANIGGFLVAFQFSYWGHRIWTFAQTEVLHREAYPRLVLVQCINFGLNESLYYVFLSLHLPYQLALLIVLSILPFFTFVSSKFWVFEV